jgi:hypothetical protein
MMTIHTALELIATPADCRIEQHEFPEHKRENEI